MAALLVGLPPRGLIPNHFWQSCYNNNNNNKEMLFAKFTALMMKPE